MSGKPGVVKLLLLICGYSQLCSLLLAMPRGKGYPELQLHMIQGCSKEFWHVYTNALFGLANKTNWVQDLKSCNSVRIFWSALTGMKQIITPRIRDPLKQQRSLYLDYSKPGSDNIAQPCTSSNTLVNCLEKAVIFTCALSCTQISTFGCACFPIPQHRVCGAHLKCSESERWQDASLGRRRMSFPKFLCNVPNLTLSSTSHKAQTTVVLFDNNEVPMNILNPLGLSP